MDASGFALELTRPGLLAGWLVLLPLVVYLFRRGLVDQPRAQRVASLIVRLAILGLLFLALAGLSWSWPTSRQFVVFLVDDSLSVGQRGREAAAAFLEQAEALAGDHEVRFLTFARQPAEFQSRFDRERFTGQAAADRQNGRASRAGSQQPEGPEHSESPQQQEGPEQREGPDQEESPEQRESPERAGGDAFRRASNLQAALELAAAAMPPSYVRQMVLLSDGNETEGRAEPAAAAAGIPVSVVPLPVDERPEVQVSEVRVPAEVPQGEPFFVEVVVDSNHDDQGVLEVYRGAHRMDDATLERAVVRRGENRFRIRQTAGDQRLLQYTARIRGFQDRLLDNNVASGLVATRGRPRILLVDGDPRSARQLEWALGQQEIAVEIRPPAGLPDSLADLQAYEAILLSNVPATELTSRQQELLRTYVRDLGGGLIMLGGDQSFGLGGYYKTAVEEILPVHCDLEKEQEKPGLAMVLLIDKSGSMGGLKMDLAKEAGKATVELLGPRDQVGVIAFDGASYWVSELRSLASPGDVVERISRMEASGGTNIYPALQDASEALTATAARLKHVILLTDGHSSGGDFEGLCRRMAAARITVSTVAVGGDADRPLLEMVARVGNGRYYDCQDPQSVPRIFAQETVMASKTALNEEPFLPQRIQATQVLEGIRLDEAPFLLGYVVTRPKATSELILASESGQPLLAWWRYGLGMSAAFTSDIKPRWASEWLAWPDFGRFWAQVIRHVMRRDEVRGGTVRVERQGAWTDVTLDSVDAEGRFRNGAATRLQLIDPRQERRLLEMPQVAPGSYRAGFDTSRPGIYYLELSQSEQGRQVFRQSRGLVVGYPDELRLKPTNGSLLRAIADVSGGRYAPRPDEVFDVGTRRARESRPLWPRLLAAAMLLFVADVGLRRMTWFTGAGNANAPRPAGNETEELPGR